MVKTFVHFRANATGTITAGGAVTNTYGLQVGNLGKTGVANAAGIAVNAQSGASTGNVELPPRHPHSTSLHGVYLCTKG